MLRSARLRRARVGGCLVALRCGDHGESPVAVWSQAGDVEDRVRSKTESTALVAIATVGLSATFGIGLAAAQPRVTEALLGEDSVQRASGYAIVKPRTEFQPDTPQIVCVFSVAGAAVGTPVNGVWIAEDVGLAAPPNSKIGYTQQTLPFRTSGRMRLSQPGH